MYLFFLFYYLFTVSTLDYFPWEIINTTNSDPVQKYGMHGQVYGPQNKIWLFGGTPENRTLVSSPEFWTGFAGASDLLRSFNPVSKTFTVINPSGSKPSARGFFDMVRGSAGWENYLFLFGGQGLNPTLEDSKDLGDLWRFNVSSLTWQNLTQTVSGTLPSARTSPAMITMPNGKIYIFGGVQSYGLFLSDLYSYNPTTNTITQINPIAGPIPGSRSITNIAKHDKYIYITNGCCDSNSETGGYYQDMWRFDTDNNVWSQIQQQGKIYSSTYSGSTVIGDWWLFQGGDQGGCLNDLPLLETSLFNFNTNTWYRNINPRYASGPLIKNAKLSLVFENVYQLGGYSSKRADEAWCVQSDQEYKGLVYKYDFINIWTVIANIINGA
jgi:hypothetical protein